MAKIAVVPVKVLAELLSDAYSADRYRGGWSGCIRMLRKEFSFSDREIEAILRSKWTRWAADSSSKSYGHATSTDLQTFLSSPRNFCQREDGMSLQKAVARLVAETF